MENLCDQVIMSTTKNDIKKQVMGHLVNDVIEQVKTDIDAGDVTAIEELILRFTELKTTESDWVIELLTSFLPEKEST